MSFSIQNNKKSNKMCVTRSCSRLLFLILGFLCLASTTNVLVAAAAEGEAETCNDNAGMDGDDDPIVQEIIDWIRDTEGGYVSQKIKVFRPEGSTIRGIYATEDIPKGETVVIVPWANMITSEGPGPDADFADKANFIQFQITIGDPELEEDEEDEEDDDTPDEWEIYYDFCKTVYNLYHDMNRNRTPYARYLKDQPRRYLPGLWSTEGQELLQKMIGKRMPNQSFNKIHNSCPYLPAAHSFQQDELWTHADMILRARGDDALLIPFYDMFNHRNGDYYNLHLVLEDEEYYKLIANRDIQKGEEIYNSYNECNRCGVRGSTFDSTDMFTFYGFVEDYPRRFTIDQVRLKFKIVEKEEVFLKVHAEEPEKKVNSEKVVKFALPPSDWGVIYMQDEIKRLEQFKLDYVNDGSVTQSELDSIWNYYDATLEAYRLAVEASENITSNVVWDECECDWEEVEDYAKEGC